jgi:putative membrane protein
MSFWKKNVSGEETTPVVDKKAQKAEAKKAKDSLSLVIDETEPGAALDLIRGNQPWLLPNGVGVILSLPVDVPVEEGGIGGLGRISSKGNEDKGSILQRIANDKIQVFMTGDMLSHNILGIIPTEQSLGAEGMGEYTLFDKAIFMLTSVDMRDGRPVVNPAHYDEYYNESTKTIDVPAGDVDTITLAQAQAISSGAVALSSLIPSLWRRLGGDVSIDDSGDTDGADEVEKIEDANVVDAADASENVENVENLPNFDPDEILDEPLDDDLPSDEGIYDGDDDVEDPFKDLDVDSDSRVNGEAVKADSADLTTKVDDDRVFGREAVRDTMARRFLDEDLGFTVDLTPFEALFGHELDDPVGFALDHLDSDNWLDSQIKLLSQQANDALVNQRRRDIEELRDLFFSLVSNTGDEIAAKMSTSQSADNIWSQTLAEADANANKSRDALVDIVGAQRAAIIKDYEQKRDEFAHSELVHARARYDDQNRASLDRQLSELEPKLRSSIDDAYAIRKREILDARKTAAQASFDASVTKVMDYLIQKRSEQVTREAELMEQFRTQMGEFLDENRKEDIARAEALREQLARQNIVDEKSAEFAAREKELHDQIARERDEAEKRWRAAQEERDEIIARMNQEKEVALAQAQEEIKRANERTEQEAARVNVVREEISRQYESQVAFLENDQKTLMAQMNRESITSKRANRLYVAFAVLVALAFLALGTIAGMLLHTVLSAGVGGATAMPWTAQVVHTVSDSVASIGGIGA